MTSPAQSSNETAGALKTTSPVIAFYLPQFHPIPENDVFWGKGYTEWSSVVRAKPLFEDHYQPRIPADLGFYDLRLPEVRQAQAELAREHGVGGFCYHHYWFRGKRVLERPLDEVLESGQPDFPFCLSWANHNWSWRRGAGDQGRLIVQDYSDEDDRDHIRWLLEVFQDERYIKVGGRPLILIYWAKSMPDPKRTFETWREEASNVGVEDPYICKVESFSDFSDPGEIGCNAAVEFWPHGVHTLVDHIKTADPFYQENQIYSYKEMVAKHLERPEAQYLRFPCVVPDWDNTARFKPDGVRMFQGSTPELYEKWLGGVIEKTSSRPPDERLVFVNAWNEWAEGAHLEPDYKHGRAYLEANKRAVQATIGEVSPGQHTEVEQAAPDTRSFERLYHDLLGKYTQLQERLTEQLSTEENSPLVQKVEQRNRELEERHAETVRRHEELRAHRVWMEGRLRELKRNRVELQDQIKKTQQRRAELEDRLKSNTGPATPQKSSGHVLIEACRRMLAKLAMVPVKRRLIPVIVELRGWLRGSGQSNTENHVDTVEKKSDR